MKVSKLLLSLLLLLPLFFTYQTDKAEGATVFSDVSSGYRAYQQITYLAQGDIISADDSSNRFYPSKHVTRAEVVTWIGKALDLNGKTTSTKFKDVSSKHPASGYIQSAVNKGIVSGYTDGTFKPDKLVTRGEMALFISRAFEYGVTKDSLAAMKVIMDKGIAQGYTNGYFGAYDNIIRADFAVFLARAIDYKQRINPKLELSGKVQYATTNDLNIRKGPSTKYGVVGKLNAGNKVEVAYKVGSWALVKSGNTIGFVSTGYLKDQASTTNSGSATTPPTHTNTNVSPAPTPAKPPVTSGKSLNGVKLVLDPGHGGTDSGAVGFGLKESDVVLDVGLHLKSLFSRTPLTVIMTRETDTFITLKKRTEIANAAKANTFVSIHANAQASTNKTANGTETWYFDGSADAKKLASYIQERLVDALDTKDRKLKSTESLYVLKNTAMTAALLELGFIDNESDNAILAAPAQRKLAANAIYNGILDYYKSEGYSVEGYYVK